MITLFNKLFHLKIRNKRCYLSLLQPNGKRDKREIRHSVPGCTDVYIDSTIVMDSSKTLLSIYNKFYYGYWKGIDIMI